MITKEKFVGLIGNYNAFNHDIEILQSVLGYGIFDSSIAESYWEMFDEVMRAYFEEEAFDDIMWWLTEKDSNPEIKMWDSDGNEIPTETIDDLWNIVETKRI